MFVFTSIDPVFNSLLIEYVTTGPPSFVGIMVSKNSFLLILKLSFSYQLKNQLNECKVAIVSSAGFIVNKKLKPFDTNIKFGDASYRIIPHNIKSYYLREYQKSNEFDHAGIVNDPFSAIPLPHLIDLANEGIIGSVSERHISLMGATINTSKLLKKTIPEIVNIFKTDEVDIALFIPV